MHRSQLGNLQNVSKLSSSFELQFSLPPGSFSFAEEATAAEEFEDDDVLDEEYDGVPKLFV
jgi:hypothetical protein